MVKFWGVLPYWLKYTTDGLKPTEGGHVSGLTIKINPLFKDDTSLFYHELEHIKQTYKTLFLHSILYSISKKYKLRSQCQAFANGQLKYNTMTFDYVVDRLFNDYNLGFSRDYIASTLRRF